MLKFVKTIDFILALIFFGVAFFYGFNERYVLASIWAVSGVISLLAAWLSPAKWIAKKMLMSRLKS